MKCFASLLLLVFSLAHFNVQANSCKNSFSNEEFRNSALAIEQENIQQHTTSKFNPKILKAGDIRGVFLTDLDFGFIEIFAKSLAQYLREKTLIKNPHVLIAHDSRIPSASISKLLIKKLLEEGVYVDRVGLMPTPVAYFLLSAYHRTAAVMITASHNPKEYIGFKTVLNPHYNTVNVAPELKEFILRQSNQSNHQLNENPNIKQNTNLVKTYEQSIDAAGTYIESLRAEFNNLNFDSFVLDTGNGASGPIAQKVFKAFGLNPHYINTKPDGNFPNHAPDPTKIKNLNQLIKKVKKTKSEFGIAFDGDGDRVVMISSDGTKITTDQFAYLFLPEFEQNKKEFKQNIIVDIKISKWFVDKAKSLGFDITTAATGYYFLKQQMKDKKAVMALERSAHIIFNDRIHRGHDDGIYNALRFVELVDKRGLDYIKKRLQEVGHFKTQNFVLRDIDKEKEESVLLAKLTQYLDSKKEKYLTLDGIKFYRGEAWAIFRFSNTENIASITVQALTTKEVEDIAKELSQVLGKTFKKEN